MTALALATLLLGVLIHFSISTTLCLDNQFPTYGIPWFNPMHTPPNIELTKCGNQDNRNKGSGLQSGKVNARQQLKDVTLFHRHLRQENVRIRVAFHRLYAKQASMPY